MAKLTLVKDATREIRKSFKRYLSIIMIIAIGTGFFVGIKATSPTMVKTAEEYYKSSNLMDLEVISTVGFSDADVEAVMALDGINGVSAGYFLDTLMTNYGQSVIHIMSYDDSGINTFSLTSGRLPLEAGECVVSATDYSGSSYSVGDVITVTEGATLCTSTLTVVGVGKGAPYFSYNFGNASIGSGTITQYAYVTPDTFLYPRYTVLYVDLDTDATFNSDEYEELVESVSDVLEKQGVEQYELYLAEIEDEIEEGEGEVEQSEKDAEQQLAEAYEELLAGKAKLEASRAELDDGWAEYNKSKQEAEAQLAEAKQTLDDSYAKLQTAQAQVDSGWAQYYAEIKSADGQLDAAYQEILDGYAQLKSMRKQIDDGWAEYNTSLAQFNSETSEYTAAETQLANAKAKLDAAEKEYEAGMAEYNAGLEEYNAGLAKVQQYYDAVAELEAARKELDDGWYQLELGQDTLEMSEEQLEDAWNQYYAGVDDYNAGLAKLEAARKELDDGWASYNEGLEAIEMIEKLKAGESITYGGVDYTIDDLRKLVNEYDSYASSVQTGKDNMELLKVVVKGDEYYAKLAKDNSDTESKEMLASALAYLAEKSGTSTIGIGLLGASQLMSYWESARSEVYSQVGVSTPSEYAAYVKNVQNQIDDYDSNADTIDSLREVIDGYDHFATFKKKISDAKTTLEASEKEYAAGKQELDDAKATLDSTYKTLNDAEYQRQTGGTSIKKNKEKLEAGEKEYAAGKAELDAQTETITAAEKELAAAKKELDAAKATLEKSRQEIDSGWSEYYTGYSQLAANSGDVLMGRSQLASAKETLLEYEEQYDDYQAQIKAGEEEYLKASGLASDEVEAAKNKLYNSQASIDSGMKKYNAGVEEYEASKKEAEEKLAAAKAELDDAEKQYAAGLAEYEAGEAEYNKQVADVQSQLSDARNTIAAAKTSLESIEEGKWYVLTREDIVQNYSTLVGDAENIDTIAQVFPLFFIAVAALVCLTTVGRMVDEQRMQLGTYEALGYSKANILFKYLFYCITAAAIGSVIGMIVGVNVIPNAIMNAYKKMYDFGSLKLVTDRSSIYIGLGVALICTVVVAMIAVLKELKSTTVALMRPKPPKSGGRIILEGTAIWYKLDFSVKNSLRNIFRHKMRMFMTVLGVLGCTSLMIAGFGLGNSFSSIVTNQYGPITKYTNIAVFTESYTKDQCEEVRNELLSDTGKEYFSDCTLLYYATTNIVDRNGEALLSVTVDVPYDTESFTKFMNLKNNANGEDMSIKSQGVIINSKISDLLDIEVGDEMYIESGDEIYSVFVTGICEQYLLNDVYMCPEYYEQVFGKEVKFNYAYFINDDESTPNSLVNNYLLTTSDNIVAAYSIDTVRSTFDDVIDNMNVIVMVMVIAAGGLAFVVLYNLTNVNIAERIREIATVDVLGFNKKELHGYVFRENIYMGVIGIVLGWFGGAALSHFIVSMLDIEEIVLVNQVNIMSYVYSTVLSIVFICFVNFVMRRIVDNVDMAESLKAVE